MRKELLNHFFSTIIFFGILTVLNKFFNLGYWPFWAGGLVGSVLPDLDHVIYVYFLEPNDLNSQRFVYLRNQGNLSKALDILAESCHGRIRLILHTTLFQ